MSYLSEVQPKLVFSTDTLVVKENARQLSEAIAACSGELAALQALLQAIQGMCKHTSRTSYYDGWSCHDCGKIT